MQASTDAPDGASPERWRERVAMLEAENERLADDSTQTWEPSSSLFPEPGVCRPPVGSTRG